MNRIGNREDVEQGSIFRSNGRGALRRARIEGDGIVRLLWIEIQSGKFTSLTRSESGAGRSRYALRSNWARRSVPLPVGYFFVRRSVPLPVGYFLCDEACPSRVDDIRARRRVRVPEWAFNSCRVFLKLARVSLKGAGLLRCRRRCVRGGCWRVRGTCQVPPRTCRVRPGTGQCRLKMGLLLKGLGVTSIRGRIRRWSGRGR